MKPYLLCLDSDGTIMDTMNLKHRECFGPVFVDVFGCQAHSKEIIDHWAHYNLFTRARGINRFKGLEEIIDYARSFGYEFVGEQYLDEWIRQTPSLSNSSLKQTMAKHPDCSLLQQTLCWSEQVNERVSNATTRPFRQAIQAIEKAAAVCDLVGVSSAVRVNVEKEWEEAGIRSFFQDLSCQEQGHKADIIRRYVDRYGADHILMIGDAIGDLEAAQQNEVLFYPILPGQEEESWQLFTDEVLSAFTTDGYTQQPYIETFFQVLQ